MSIDTGQVLESEGADHIFRQSVVQSQNPNLNLAVI